jgi:hypothetical protein
MMLVALIWFMSTLVLLRYWHLLFYGRPRGDLLYRDLTFGELLPFAVMIALLLLPAGLFPGTH